MTNPSSDDPAAIRERLDLLREFYRVIATTPEAAKTLREIRALENELRRHDAN